MDPRERALNSEKFERSLQLSSLTCTRKALNSANYNPTFARQKKENTGIMSFNKVTTMFPMKLQFEKKEDPIFTYCEALNEFKRSNKVSTKVNGDGKKEKDDKNKD